MTSRPGRRGRSKTGSHLLAAGLTLSMGYAFGLFTLGGCGGSQAGFAPHVDGQLPDRVVEKLKDCSKRGPTPLQSVKHTVAFDVFMDTDGRVEQVALKDSTLHLDEIEACMEGALHSLSGPATNASLRRRERLGPGSVPPATRVHLANPIVFGAGALEVVIVVGFMVVTVIVYYHVVRNTKTHRPPPPQPLVEEPPKPEPPRPEPQISGDPRTTDPPPPLPPRLPDCPRNESFSPIRTDNATGCTDKNGNVRCYSSKHHPCAGVHTHGKLSYQEIRNGVCKAVERRAVRCEGPFKVSGSCGSTPTVECKTGGTETSGTLEE